MGYVVRMPQLGMTMEEGVVVEWLVDVDEPFEEGDPIIEVESEKTVNDVQAREPGVLVERLVQLNEAVEPGDPIAYVGEAGEEPPADIDGRTRANESEESAEPADAERPARQETEGVRNEVAPDQKISPRARAFARDHEIHVREVSDLEGSGPDGAVIEQDVIDAVQSDRLAKTTTLGPLDRGIFEERAGSQLRRSVAEQMTASANEAPQVTLNRKVAVGSLLSLKEDLEQQLDLDLSLTDFLLCATAEALGDHPEFNAVYEEGVLRLASRINIGLAVDLPDGLVTPVLRDVDAQGLPDIAASRRDIVERVQAGDYTGDDLAGGTFTITNLGHFGVDTFDPLLNVPEVAILGVGRITRSAEGTNTNEASLSLSLTFDHRPNDGADAARFLNTLARYLQEPLTLLGIDHSGKPVGAGGFTERADPLPYDRYVEVSSAGQLQPLVRSRQFEWKADEPPERGGTDSAPTPVEQFLGSLGACLSITIELVAERREISLDHVDVVVDAEPADEPIEHIDVAVTIESDEAAEDIHRIVETAERACYVSRLINEDIERTLSVTQHRASTA